jgi:6-phosphogluconolactonase
VASIEDSPKPPPCRVTLTYPIINNALCAVFAFAGAAKAELVKVFTFNELIDTSCSFLLLL